MKREDSKAVVVVAKKCWHAAQRKLSTRSIEKASTPVRAGMAHGPATEPLVMDVSKSKRLAEIIIKKALLLSPFLVGSFFMS